MILSADHCAPVRNVSLMMEVTGLLYITLLKANVANTFV